ncbi:uncharacterized protein EV154DRAFT_479272 [Mucor mucedo]|uniref:uncharacterized protein n=1 Tax=Mucor mucedo TaxID=29922 RepID=UPI00221E4E12|nr:uncharacterized protein EV154DRAFT_479272 [Mucor mucedo]KAI7893520.1 hypothetical protein EV154DRAFT_479272 [Mucor mucedo]
MDVHAVFGVEPNHNLTEAEVTKYDLPDLFISLKAFDWLSEEKVASKFVASVFGKIDSSAPALSSINQALLKINAIADIPTPIRELSDYVRKHYRKKKIIVRFDHYLSTSKKAYQLDKAKGDAAHILLEENYRIHGSLAGKTVDEILEVVGASGINKNDANDSDDSCTSQKYHPKRSRKYSVSVPKDDYEGLPASEGSEMIDELKEVRCRSIELTETNANQVSDLRLLSLDCIYLFSEDIKQVPRNRLA